MTMADQPEAEPTWRFLEFSVHQDDYPENAPPVYEVMKDARFEDGVVLYRLRLGPNSRVRIDGVQVSP